MYCYNISTICNLFLILTTIYIKTTTLYDNTSESCRLDLSSILKENETFKKSEIEPLDNSKSKKEGNTNAKPKKKKVIYYGNTNRCQDACSWFEYEVCRKDWFQRTCLGFICMIFVIIIIFLLWYGVSEMKKVIRECGGYWYWHYRLCFLPYLNRTGQLPANILDN